MSLTPKSFRAKYYYKKELIELCREFGLDNAGQKIELEERILSYLKGEKVVSKMKIKKTKWVQDKLGLDCEVTENYKNNKATRDFFTSIIGKSFKFNGAIMNYKKLHPNQKIVYQDLVDAYYADKADQKLGVMTSERYYPGNRYNKFVKSFYLDPNNKGKTRKEMIKAWQELKKSGKVNEL